MDILILIYFFLASHISYHHRNSICDKYVFQMAWVQKQMVQKRNAMIGIPLVSYPIVSSLFFPI